MRFPANILLVLLAVFGFAAARAQGNSVDYVRNEGQWPKEVRYRASVQGGHAFLTNTGFLYSYYSLDDIARIHSLTHDENVSAQDAAARMVRCHAYRVTLEGCNSSAPDKTEIRSRRTQYYNFFLGSDSSKWAGNVPAFSAVSYENIYPGIDLVAYGKDASIKYDFIVGQNGNPKSIKLKFEGATPKVTADGDLLIQTGVNKVLEKAPYAYQVWGSVQKRVACRYVVKNNVVSFVFPEGYDHSLQLFIDPVLDFATYSGSTSTTFGWSATYDTAGNLYAGGQSFGTGWPVTLGAFQMTYGGLIDASINKYNSNGTALIYSTYFGGDSADYPNTMVVNQLGELVMAGNTHSTNLPTTIGAYDNSFNGGTDIYVVHFNTAGAALLGSTYLGGSGLDGNVSTSLGSQANRGEIITDTSGNIYIAFATTSPNFPTTTGAFQTTLRGGMDGFVSKLNSTCSSLLLSTYLGGTGNDAAICMQLSPTGKIIIGGGTTSGNFPGTIGSWQPSNSGSTDGFIAVLNNNATSLLHATYIGTSGADDVSKLQLDASGYVYATGVCSTGSFPVSPFVYADSNGRNYIIKMDSALSTRILSTTVGGQLSLAPSAFLVDLCGNIYFMAYGPGASGLPVTSDAFQTTPASFWMCVLNPNMASLRYASLFGAVGDHLDGGSSRLDPKGVAYHSICTDKNGMPTNSSVWSPLRLTGGFDVASWKFSFQLSGMKAGFDLGGDTICTPALIKLNNTTIGATSYLWDFGDGSAQSTLHTPPPHLYSKAGVYKIKLYTYNITACTPFDSATRMIHVFEPDTVRLTPIPEKLCGKDSARMSVKPQWIVTVTPNAGVTYKQIGGNEIIFHPNTSTTYVVTASNPGPCHVPPADTLRFTIIRDTSVVEHINPITDTILCNRDTAVYRLAHKLSSFSIKPSKDYSLSADSLTLRFFPSLPTSYELIAVKANICDTVRDTMRFTIHKANVKAAFDLSPKLTDQKEAEFRLTNRSTAAAASSWFVNWNYWTSETNPVYHPKDTGTYCFALIASNEYCRDTATDCGRFIETHIYVPTAFSPNGDGRNDIFRPIQNNTEVLEFSIYNRYGQRLFVCHDNVSGWDGRFRGEPCDMGVYFWKLRYRVMQREEVMLKGDVTLVR